MSRGKLLKQSTVYNDRGLYELSLSNDVIEWKRLQEHRNSLIERVKVQEIVVATQKNCSFSVHVIDRQPNHRWAVKELTFSCNNDKEAEDWVKCISELLSQPEFKRPKRLLVFVNPNGGGGRCKTIYCRDVEPLFELAGIDTTVVYTTSGTQAPEMLKNYDFASIDGVVAVGGDGTAHLVAGALLERAYRDAGEDLNKADAKVCKTPIRLGLIPSGSTDLFCHKYTIGTRDPSTAALHVIIGDDIEVDTCVVRQKENFRSFCIVAFTRGLIGDLFHYSENYYMRKLGTARYIFINICMTSLYQTVHIDLKYKTSNEDTEWKCLSDEFSNIVMLPLGLRDKLITGETGREKSNRLRKKLSNGKLFMFAHQKRSRRDHVRTAPVYNQLFFGDHSDLTDAKSVYHVEATEVKLKTKEGCLSLDGEAGMINEPMDLHVRVHQANLRLFARGVEEPVA